MSADAASSLHLAILRRNARFRAWRSAGVPVEGGWRLMQPGRKGHEWAALALRCGACGWEESGGTGGKPWLGKTWGWMLEEEEEDALIGVDRKPTPPSIGDWHCPHLTPLLSPDPPEVVATTELEMLAG